MQRCRGYIGSREYAGTKTPQHIQNLTIRDYCQKNRMQYLLSITEYAMPGCYLMLQELLTEAAELDGVVLYSWWMLPKKKERRLELCRSFVDAGCSIHGALEGVSASSMEGVLKHEDVWVVEDILRDQNLEALIKGSF